jgi:hypothetical protein
MTSAGIWQHPELNVPTPHSTSLTSSGLQTFLSEKDAFRGFGSAEEPRPVHWSIFHNVTRRVTSPSGCWCLRFVSRQSLVSTIPHADLTDTVFDATFSVLRAQLAICQWLLQYEHMFLDRKHCTALEQPYIVVTMLMTVARQLARSLHGDLSARCYWLVCSSDCWLRPSNRT